MTETSLKRNRWDLVPPEKPPSSRPGLLGNLVGQRSIDRTVSSGMFVCPHEGIERAYWKHRVRNWFSLFARPLIPGKVVAEYVECFCCGGITDPAIVGAKHPALGTLKASS